MIGEMLSEVPKSAPFVVGADGFHVPRSSRKMPGSGWMRGLKTAKFKPGIERGQRFVQGSWLTPIVNGYSRALPIRCLPAFTAKSVPSQAEPRTEVKAGLTFLQWTRQQMDTAGRTEQTLLTLNDGRYDTLDFWPGLPERTIGVVRTARNRSLYVLPTVDAHGNRKYGDKAPAPHRWFFNTLWCGFRKEMWQQPQFRATWTWSRDNWLVNEPLWDALFNPTLASTRV